MILQYYFLIKLHEKKVGEEVSLKELNFCCRNRFESRGACPRHNGGALKYGTSRRGHSFRVWVALASCWTSPSLSKRPEISILRVILRNPRRWWWLSSANDVDSVVEWVRVLRAEILIIYFARNHHKLQTKKYFVRFLKDFSFLYSYFSSK